MCVCVCVEWGVCVWSGVGSVCVCVCVWSGVGSVCVEWSGECVCVGVVKQEVSANVNISHNEQIKR